MITSTVVSSDGKQLLVRVLRTISWVQDSVGHLSQKLGDLSHRVDDNHRDVIERLDVGVNSDHDRQNWRAVTQGATEVDSSHSVLCLPAQVSVAVSVSVYPIF